jgi:leader peptidase (prepilin peptidase)/N-methyltransferase
VTAVLELFQDQEGVFLAVVGVFGLMVGSFLNVVIHRLPIMMERTWKRECRDFLGLEAAGEPLEAFNLVVPRSRCPECGKLIAAHENIPVASYLALGGRCSGCGTRISPRYPAVELLTAALSVVVAWHFGPTVQTVAGLALTFSLIALSFIDIDRQLLPDSITLPMLWGGLVLSLFGIYVDSTASILGAVLGYLSLWSVYHLFKLATGKEGMGFGDFKLLALLGAWLGWSKLPAVILLSSLVGAVVGISMIVLLRRDHRIPIPFGPYLAAAGWIALIWGDAINTAYLGFAHISG